MPTIDVNEGTPLDDRDDGTYWATLVKCAGPTRIFPSWAGPEGSDVLEWTFAFDDGGEIRDSSGPVATPRAKVTGWIKALTGRAPVKGEKIETDALIGRRVLLTVGHKESGWPKIDALASPPVDTLQREFAQQTGTPTRTTTPPRGRPQSAPASAAPLNLAPTPPAAAAPVPVGAGVGPTQTAEAGDLPF